MDYTVTVTDQEDIALGLIAKAQGVEPLTQLQRVVSSGLASYVEQADRLVFDAFKQAAPTATKQEITDTVIKPKTDITPAPPEGVV